MTTFDAAAAFRQAFDSEVSEELAKSGVPCAEWRKGGRASKQYPDKEDGTWWSDHGPGMVDNYVAWRANTPWTIFTHAGEPAIELQLNPIIGGVPVKMFLDRVFATDSGEPVLVDLKTGSRTPESALQLGFYRVGLLQILGLQVDLGGYWMARQGNLSNLEDISRYDEHLIGGMLRQFVTARDAGVFIPSPSSLCKSCSVNHACALFGGAEAAQYDDLHPHYQPVIRPAQLEVPA